MKFETRDNTKSEVILLSILLTILFITVIFFFTGDMLLTSLGMLLIICGLIWIDNFKAKV